jgi:hypothetical protein
MVNKYTKKDGSQTDYDQKAYNKTYYEKNKEKINNEKYTCVYCNKEMKERNKFNHQMGEKHKLKKQLYETLNNMLERVEVLEAINDNVE